MLLWKTNPRCIISCWHNISNHFGDAVVPAPHPTNGYEAVSKHFGFVNLHLGIILRKWQEKTWAAHNCENNVLQMGEFKVEMFGWIADLCIRRKPNTEYQYKRTHVANFVVWFGDKRPV